MQTNPQVVPSVTTTTGATDAAQAHTGPATAPQTAGRVAEALSHVVGERYTHHDAETVARWARTTLPHGTRPLAVVQPRNSQQVQEVVRVAGNFGVPLYPISRGKNWGYGDACAVLDDQVIVDLSRMDRIVDVDTELGVATLEPGVTQGQLEDYLRQRNLPYWVDATGAGASVSIVGNIVERGFGHTPAGDRFLNCCGMEVVLGSGELLKTGFGHYAQSRVAGAYKWGVGPYLDGLFTQFNAGIVTRLSLWLLPRPDAFRALFFTLSREDDIGSLVPVLRRLRLQGTLQTPVHVFNDLRLIAGSQRYPWDQADGKTPLSPELVAELRRRHGVGAWTGSAALYGSHEEVAAAIRVVKRAFNGVRGMRQLLFVDDRRMKWLRWTARLASRLGLLSSLAQRIHKLEQGYQLLKGNTAALNFRTGLWRHTGSPIDDGGNRPYDPLDHNAGFIWLSPVLPMRQSDVRRFLSIGKPIFAAHGFDFEVTLSAVTARALCAVTTISYNRDNPNETQRARSCHDTLLRAVLDAGYPPYRAGNLAMPLLDHRSSVFWDVSARLKAALDPHGIIAPGRYEPVRFRRTRQTPNQPERGCASADVSADR